ncbi:hypothetical protein [Streptomyces sp. NPDC001851]|uniref:hypothetical protein n=1 Tax=Streptomyces sp. NPDC001851 TaxID=3154529 RepID=UPI0033164FAE
MSLTRVGAARQALAKGLAVQGADRDMVMTAVERRGLPELGGERLLLLPHQRHRAVMRLVTPPAWWGTRAARAEGFDVLAQAIAAVADAARQAGGALTVPGVSLDGTAVPPDGDLHRLETTDPVERELLYQLLRRHSPTLIALAGRGSFSPGGRRDRIGSRWLADSGEHLTAREIGPVTERHLERVYAELRRRDGISHLDRMDLAPAEDGRTVLVRCLDAQATLAEVRAHMLLLDALALRARGQARKGQRQRPVRQDLLDDNRARAVAEGLRAVFIEDRPQKPGRDRDDTRRGDTGRDDARRGGPRRDAPGRDEPRRGGPAGERRERRRPARQAARALLDDLVPELAKLDATAEELLPLLNLVELPGRTRPPCGQDLLRLDTARRPPAETLRAGLTDTRPGGPLLPTVVASHPGSAALMLQAWRAALAAGEPLRERRGRDEPGRPGRAGPRREDRPPSHRRRRPPGKGPGAAPDGRRDQGQARGGNQQ